MILPPAGETSAGDPIRVLIVDDSAAVRRMVTAVLGRDPAFTIVGTANSGFEAIERVRELNPEVVTMDVEMPGMDGLAALREIRKDHPKLPVVMFSTLTERGARATLEALASGASDYVTKPTRAGSLANAVATIREQLVPKARALAERNRRASGKFTTGAKASAPTPPPIPAVPPGRRGATGGRVDLLAIGCSTGGPEALPIVLRELPAKPPVPVLITQHMPPLFTRMLAARLDSTYPFHVVEAADGQVLEAGTVYLAPGDFHMTVARSGSNVVTKLNQDPPENFCRPAVDVMFRSIAEIYGNRAMAVVLTGMGSDGAKSAALLYAAGAEIVIQDEPSSVVWGMPGAVFRAGIADKVLPLDRIGGHCAIALRRHRLAAAHAAT